VAAGQRTGFEVTMTFFKSDALHHRPGSFFDRTDGFDFAQPQCAAGIGQPGVNGRVPLRACVSQSGRECFLCHVVTF
jgi:hypothetical protein